MQKDKSTAKDEVSITLETVDQQPERKEYVVIAECGLFKNGKHYEKGSIVKLDINTFTNFKNNGDVKEKY